MLSNIRARSGIRRLWWALALCLTGCGDGRTPPPDANVIVTNAAPSFTFVTFMRVERPEAALSYRDLRRFPFDADEYRFHLETLALDGTANRRFSTTQVVDQNSDYIFVINESSGTLALDVFEFPLLPAASALTNYVMLHAAATLGPVDVFLAAPGADLSTIAPTASLALGEQLPMQSISGGSYEFSLTVQGDPTTVLMRSGSVAIVNGLNLAFVLVDPNGIETASALAVSSGGTSVVLLDQNTQAGLRVINAVADRNGIDVLLDESSTPLIDNLAYGIPSADFEIEPGDRDFTVTPTGNPGVLLIDGLTLPITAGNRYMLTVHGAPGSVVGYPSFDPRRPLPDRAQLRYLNSTSDREVLEFALTRTEFDRRVRLLPRDLLNNFEFAPNDYMLTVRNPTDATILAGPIPVTLAAGGVYTVLAIDHATNSNQVELTLFDDFN